MQYRCPFCGDPTCDRECASQRIADAEERREIARENKEERRRAWAALHCDPGDEDDAEDHSFEEDEAVGTPWYGLAGY